MNEIGDQVEKMAYQIDLSGQDSKDIEFHKKSGNKALLKKLSVLLEELTEHMAMEKK